MLNAEDTGSMENLFEIRRYQIDIENEQVRLMYIQTCQLESFQSFYTFCRFKAFFSSWENNAAEAQPYYNQFDFPKVNPNYYGRYPTIMQSIIPNVQTSNHQSIHYSKRQPQLLRKVSKHHSCSCRRSSPFLSFLSCNALYLPQLLCNASAFAINDNTNHHQFVITCRHYYYAYGPYFFL